MTIRVIVGIAALGALVVAEREHAAHRKRMGSSRQPRRHPGEGYVPPPFFGG